MSNFNKYLKYKKKYLDLKKLQGGFSKVITLGSYNFDLLNY